VNPFRAWLMLNPQVRCVLLVPVFSSPPSAADVPSPCGWCPFKKAAPAKGHCINISNQKNGLCPLTNNTIHLE
jgi:hypothetical protein